MAGLVVAVCGLSGLVDADGGGRHREHVMSREGDGGGMEVGGWMR